MREKLSHIDARGRAAMVDVSAKPPTRRRAVARGFVRMKPQTVRLIARNELAKGDVFGAARIAGVRAAKQTPALIPLAHPLPLTHVGIELRRRRDGVEIEADAECVGPTGVEMEALTAVSIAALVLYDMCKAVDRSMTIEAIRLMRKEGGKSGLYVRVGR